MPHPSVEAAAARAVRQLPETLAALSGYLTVPAISCDPAHAADVAALAGRVRDDLAALGLAARILSLEGALPCVAAEWSGRPGAPTVLVYGHLDLQPVKGEPWDTPPHDATVKGDRMYARGAADDMGGWVSHLAALRAWFEEAGGPPCNVKLLIEGEEEIGSPNLERYMDAFPEAFAADAMILTDCENPSPDVPGLTVSLRGLFELEVTCEALSADGHSGLWGNMVPDVSTALVLVLARLFDADGRLRIGRVTVDEGRRATADAVSPAPETIREGGHLLPGVEPLPVRDRSAAEWMWWQPACTVVASTLPTPDRKKNALRTRASATLSVRVAPGQRREDLEAVLRSELLRDPPGGVRVSVEPRGTPGDGWLYTPKGEAFAAADRAYVKAWGRPLAQVGVGGSIPFVALFGRRFSRLPLILNGVMDPLTTAHGPNESLHLGLFRKAVVANVHLYAELAAVGADRLGA
jgi:acetylornithine deacetylase/succinyl-diaminopimelate desuccinylase-like protein